MQKSDIEPSPRKKLKTEVSQAENELVDIRQRLFEKQLRLARLKAAKLENTDEYKKLAAEISELITATRTGARKITDLLSRTEN